MDEGQKNVVGAGNPNFSGFLTPQGGGVSSNPQGFTQGVSLGGTGSFSSGAGDVVLPVTPSGGSKKRGLIIAAVALFLVAIGAGVAAVVVNSQKEQSDIYSLAYVKEKFNVYANYLLYGTESKNKIEDLSAESHIISLDYKFNEVLLSGGTSKTAYFINLNKYFNEFKVGFENSVETKALDINDVVAVYLETYDEFYDMLRIKAGEEFEVPENLKDYQNTYKIYVWAQERFNEVISAHNCNGDEACVLNMELKDSEMEVLNVLEQNRVMVEGMEENFATGLVEGCDLVNSALEGGNA